MQIMRRGNNRSGRGRHRNMYNLTGIPGWVRFGESPGYSGGRAGLGPCAAYLQKTGQMPDFIQDLYQENPEVSAYWSRFPVAEAPLGKDERKQLLVDRMKQLEEEISDIKRKIKELR